MYQIDKQFDFCYSHRVYVQRLNKEYCAEGDYNVKCRHIHGHQGKIHLFAEASELDDRSMVIDFKEMGFLKDFIDSYIDHKFIIDYRDPMFDHLVTDLYKSVSNNPVITYIDIMIPGTSLLAGKVIDLKDLQHLANTPTFEILEGYFVVDFVPTSERLSKWIFDIAQEKLNGLGAVVARVDWWETPKSRSSWRRCPLINKL